MTASESRIRGSGQVVRGLLLALLLAAAPVLHAQPNAETSVKAAFLLNFARFVEWPPAAFASPEAPLELCLFGKDPFGPVLDAIVQGEMVNGRPLVVRRISQRAEATSCHTLFVDPSLKDATKTLTAIPGARLTVGEGGQFIREGGMIALVLDRGKIRFDINQTAAERAGLKISSRLLSVARSVVKR